MTIPEEATQVSTNLAGKTAVVTGGGRGIGRAVSLELAARGVTVVVGDRFRDDGGPVAQAVAAEIETAGGTAVAVGADVATEDGAQSLVDAGLRATGRVDILVNCAGNNVRAPFAQMTTEQWNSVMDVHVKGHFFCSRAAVRAMLDRREGGRIVTVASRGAFFSPPPHKAGDPPHRLPSVVYSTAKAAILGMTSTLALELAPAGITVNALIPSADTQLFPGRGARGSGGVPPTIDLDPSFIAPFVAFLGTDAAAGITGRFVYVTGGDVCFFAPPLRLTGAKFVRKPGRWTVEELAQTIPPIAAAG